MNLRDVHLEGVARLAESLGSVEAIELEQYHPIGLAKYESLGLTAGYGNTNFLSPDALSEQVKLMRRITSKPIRLSTGESI